MSGLEQFCLTPEELADIKAGERDLRLGKVHSLADWDDLEADGILCLGFADGATGHVHWPLTAYDPALD